MVQDLFKSIVKKERHSELYQNIRDNPIFLPTKMMIQDVFNTFDDVDGNFVEQFQTTGFDARLFELYIWAWLREMGAAVDRSHQYPDYLIEKGAHKIAIEATIAAGHFPERTTLTNKDNDPLLTRDVLSEEFQHFLRNDVPLIFTSPILSKLKKKYWLHEHCKDIPFVIFLGGFFENGSNLYTCGPLASILFGYEYAQNLSGEAYGRHIAYHEKADVKIPSGLFFQPTKEWADMENVSAIIFSNAGTTAKFKRMGWAKGYYNARQIIKRSGIMFNPRGKKPLNFEYYLDAPPFRENWGDEVVVIHNPNAKYPLPRDLFSDYVNMWYENGVLQTSAPKEGVYILFSMTSAQCFDDIRFHHPSVERITKSEFNKLIQISKITPGLLDMYWFKNPVNQKIAAIYYGGKGQLSSYYLFRIFSKREHSKTYRLTAESEKFQAEETALKDMLSAITATY